MTFKDVANEMISKGFVFDLSFDRIFLSLIVTFLLSLWIFFVYKKNTQNEFYSKNFNISLALVPVITSSIILAMQSNLVISLGMVGALSIIRYRTAIKNSLDLFFMFWAISVGIICGAGQYILACIMSLFVTFLLTALSKMDFSKKTNLLIVRCNKASDLASVETDVKKVSSFYKIKSKTINATIAEIIFEYKASNDISNTLSNKKYIKDFQIISNN